MTTDSDRSAVSDKALQTVASGCVILILGFIGSCSLWAYERDRQDRERPAPTVAPLCARESCTERLARAVCMSLGEDRCCETYVFEYERRCVCDGLE